MKHVELQIGANCLLDVFAFKALGCPVVQETRPKTGGFCTSVPYGPRQGMLGGPIGYKLGRMNVHNCTAFCWVKACPTAHLSPFSDANKSARHSPSATT